MTRRDYLRDYRREQRQAHRAAGLCSECKCVAEPGQAQCVRHRARAALRYSEWSQRAQVIAS
jgi:uncharacterized OB-fold protein